MLRCVGTIPARCRGSVLNGTSGISRTMQSRSLMNTAGISSFGSAGVRKIHAAVEPQEDPATFQGLSKQSPSNGLQTYITQLSNGVRVATQESLGHFVSAGIYVDSGSKYESLENAGASHLLDRMAFKSTENLGTPELIKELESLGGNVMAHSSREGIIYQAAVFRHDLAKMMKIYGQMVRRPLFTESELEETKESTRYELREITNKMDMIMSEVVHSVAFQADTVANETVPLVAPASEIFPIRTNTLGNPLIVDLPALEAMSSETMKKFHNTWYTPDRIVVAGVGMDHARLVELAEQEFGNMPLATPEIVASQRQRTLVPKYTGGLRVWDTSCLPPSPNPDDTPLTHVHMAFESMSLTDPDIYALSVLTSLMGGGGSFSAGGPGKGMYTRLYTQVLNRCGWVDSCSMMNYTYADTGLLSIQAAVIPDRETHRLIIPVLADQLVNMTKKIQDTELSRAKNQLKSNLLMSLESKMVELEDIGRQALAHSRRLSSVEMCRRVDMVTGADLNRVARRIIFGEDIPSPLDFGDPLAQHWKRSGNGDPTILVYGPLVGSDDPLCALPDLVKTYGLGRTAAKSFNEASILSGNKRNWFNFSR
ncbi:hypothetical protein BASA50_000267 [Batrachochytrium salamandrivorans]|uniref:Alpha-MPP n=1 Tax=Batrachochytrium salamandrivorans TaxID=1357716 RepID=A0ABQ8EXR6_9FUNG|nr:hypothetical protein BASA60_001041 [Batrachochytrium salamandrivorans]KAH6586903.1 hypothetical protein BASA50_000267 [Batrachochytrium salamandrivorans]KAJ1341453.1 hypothetical protein BSLG_003882 [Batrachochytrium salamandrivorans]